MTTNVIDFQKAKKNRELRKMDEVVEELEDIEVVKGEIAYDAIMNAVDNMQYLKLDIQDNPRCIIDLYLIAEGIISLVDRLSGEDHPLQSIADQMVLFAEEVEIPEDQFESTEDHERLMTQIVFGEDEG